VLIGKTRERGCSLRVMGLARARQAVCGEVHPRAGLRPPRPVPRALAGRAPARHLRGRRRGDRTGHLVRARRPAPDRQAPDCQAPAFVPMLAVGPLMDSTLRACRVGQPVERCSVARTFSIKGLVPAPPVPRAPARCAAHCLRSVCGPPAPSTPAQAAAAHGPAETASRRDVSADGCRCAAEVLVADRLARLNLWVRLGFTA